MHGNGAASWRFRHLQEQVHTRQRLIHEGVKSQPRLLGLIPRAPVMLSEEERFRELDLLVRDYDAIIAGLQEGKKAYEAFFAQLATGVQQAVRRKGDEIRQLEQERAALQASALTQQDAALEQWARQSAEQLWQSVYLLGQATLLLLKKVAVCWEGTNRLTADQELPRQVLSQLVGQLENHRRAYTLQKRIDRVVHEVAQMAADVELAASGSTVTSVLEALDNIALLIEARLAPLVPDPASTPVLGLLPTSEKLWVNSIDMEFVLIPAEIFAMGSEDERPTHQVTISQPFYLERCAVTQIQWVAIMGKNPSKFQGGNRPVENVSWEDVQEFICKLNARESGKQYRLPTEAEWEYAARAGSTTTYSFGDDEDQLGEYAWYAANAGGRRTRLDSAGQTPGEYAIRMATFRNGCRIGMERILRDQSRSHPAPLQARPE